MFYWNNYSKIRKNQLFRSIFSKQFLVRTDRFIREYIFQRGFLDGRAGLKIAKAHFIYTYKKYMYLGL